MGNIDPIIETTSVTRRSCDTARAVSRASKMTNRESTADKECKEVTVNRTNKRQAEAKASTSKGRSDSESTERKSRKRGKRGGRKHKKVKKCDSQTNTSTNIYEVLSTEEDGDDESSERSVSSGRSENSSCDDDEMETETNTKAEKPPPIVIHERCNYRDLVREVDKHTTKPAAFKFTRERTIIFAENINDFHALKRGLAKNEAANWHTYATKEEKTHGFALFGVENDATEEEIKQDLIDSGIECKSVNKMKNVKSPIYVVITSKNDTLNSLRKKAKAVTRVIVRWERLKNKAAVVQCHKCQGWGHASQPHLLNVHHN